MIIVVFYEPATGIITECAAGPKAWMDADGRPYLEVPHFRPDWDITHRVVGGELVERDA
ncbi:hypothetical protein [Sphingobium lactosutens]|uniref:hypothetical protein n=1 Tax=Sphingobium lactosutens TaxID=522773 RepID=UPI0015C05290|nr:hypothetical protein [Sphingobium lactosutens]